MLFIPIPIRMANNKDFGTLSLKDVTLLCKGYSSKKIAISLFLFILIEKDKERKSGLIEYIKEVGEIQVPGESYFEDID